MSYRQIFDEAIGHAPPSGVDVDRVVRRQRRAARVRPALATLAAAAVVAAGGGAAIQLTGEEGAPVQVPGDALAGFPEYLDGFRVIAAAEGPITDPLTLTLTFTPGIVDVMLLSRCESDQVGDIPVVVSAELTASAAPASITEDWFCAVEKPRPGSDFGGTETEGWGGFWDAPAADEPTTVTITIRLVDPRPMYGGGETDFPDGTFAVAVAERKAFDEYEFPPMPETLTPIPDTQPLVAELRPDPTDPNRPVETTVEWDPALGSGCGEGVLPLELVSQTPGSLHVTVNGVPVADQTWWDYGQAESAHDLYPLCGEFSDGDEITIGVEPEHMTGDWRVGLRTGG